MNLTLNHGVRTALEYAKSGDIAKARALPNPDSAPHVSFVDMGGHGYGVVRASVDRMDTEFVCIPRPIERAMTDDGGPLRYRVVHSAKCGAKANGPFWNKLFSKATPNYQFNGATLSEKVPPRTTKAPDQFAGSSVSLRGTFEVFEAKFSIATHLKSGA